MRVIGRGKQVPADERPCFISFRDFWEICYHRQLREKLTSLLLDAKMVYITLVRPRRAGIK